MALEYGKRGRESRGVPEHFLPKEGEIGTLNPVEKKRKFEAMREAGGTPDKARKTLAIHLNNGATWIEPTEGDLPGEAVFAVRARPGLILILEDGSGQVLEGSLADAKPKRKKPGPKPKAPPPPSE